MIRILFVDDEPKVLQGLQRLLRPMRNEWEAHYCESAEAGLELLAESEFDVVVSDVKMPGMSGEDFLAVLQTRHPRIVRIALSGHSDRQSIIKSMGPTHRFISKPCEPDLLKSVVTAACALRDLLSSAHLQKVVAGLDSLPSPSRIGQQLAKELESSEVSTARVGAIIEKDMAITAKILQMANSAFFGSRQRVSSVVQAVSILGVDSVKMLLSVTEIFSTLGNGPSNEKETADIYEHSLRTGTFAKALAKSEKLNAHAIEDALIAGLLHDIGKLVLAWKSPREYKKSVEMIQRNHISDVQAEKQVFGTTHAEVGAYLLGLWGLPDTVVEAIAFHHTPSKSGSITFTPLTAVHFADACDIVTKDQKLEDCLDMAHLSDIGMTNRISLWLEELDDLSMAA